MLNPTKFVHVQLQKSCRHRVWYLLKCLTHSSLWDELTSIVHTSGLQQIFVVKPRIPVLWF